MSFLCYSILVKVEKLQKILVPQVTGYLAHVSPKKKSELQFNVKML